MVKLIVVGATSEFGFNLLLVSVIICSIFDDSYTEVVIRGFTNCLLGFAF